MTNISRIAATLLLISTCVWATRAQNAGAPIGEVTVEASAGRHEYCLGPSGLLQLQGADFEPDDITLRITLNERYENHLSRTIILPRFSRRIHGITVEGQSGMTVLRNTGGGMDVEAVMAMPAPASPFTLLAPGKQPPVFDSLVTSPSQTVIVPVLNQSSALDLRGQTVQVVISRDYGSLPQDVVATLNERWSDYGTVWAGVVESRLTVRIPREPLTWDRNCLNPALLP